MWNRFLNNEINSVFFNQLKAGSRFELRDGSNETSLSLRREVRSFEILIPDPFVSRGEGIYNTIALKLPIQDWLPLSAFLVLPSSCFSDK